MKLSSRGIADNFIGLLFILRTVIFERRSNGWVAYKFQTSPVMSSYQVCIAVGDFVAVEAEWQNITTYPVSHNDVVASAEPEWELPEGGGGLGVGPPSSVCNPPRSIIFYELGGRF
jgi:hypothetical protein